MFGFSKYIVQVAIFLIDELRHQCSRDEAGTQERVGFEEPVSRAFWGSEDPEEDSADGPTFSLEWSGDTPKSIKTLVVVAGKTVTDIIDKSIANHSEKVCTVNSTGEFNVAALHRLVNDVYVCIVTKSVDLATAGRFVDAISDTIKKSEKVFAFTDEMITRLCGEDRDSVDNPTMWRSLSTEKGREKQMSKVPALKHPNFVVGVAAGVIGYADIMDIPGTLYILYISEAAYDMEIIDPLLKLFKDSTDNCLPEIDRSGITLSNKLKLYI